jgi:hypothetical protein
MSLLPRPALAHLGASLLLAVLPLAARAAADNGLPALRVTAGNVFERRPQADHPGSTELTLSIQGEGLPPGTQLRQVVITRAEDDLGNRISAGNQSQLDLPTGAGIGSVTARLRLGVIPRRASLLKVLEGQFELQVPSEADGSIVRVADPLKQPGPVERPALAENGILLWTYSDAASYARLCTELNLEPEPMPDFPRALGFFVRDPSAIRRFAGHVLLDGSGRAIPNTQSSSRGRIETGLLVNIALPTLLPGGAQLLFSVGLSRDFKTVPFRVEDIPLP